MYVESSGYLLILYYNSYEKNCNIQPYENILLYELIWIKNSQYGLYSHNESRLIPQLFYFIIQKNIIITNFLVI